MKKIKLLVVAAGLTCLLPLQGFAFSVQNVPTSKYTGELIARVDRRLPTLVYRSGSISPGQVGIGWNANDIPREYRRANGTMEFFIDVYSSTRIKQGDTISNKRHFCAFPADAITFAIREGSSIPDDNCLKDICHPGLYAEVACNGSACPSCGPDR